MTRMRYSAIFLLLCSPQLSAQNVLYEWFDVGTAVACIGDVNGDGTADVACSTVTDPRSVSVFSGLDGVFLYSVAGDSHTDLLGQSIAGEHDVDGDGHMDFVVGDRWDDQNGTTAGAAWVYSGVDGAVLHKFTGTQGSLFGTSVAMLGDLDQDGHAEILVGAPQDNTGHNNGGRALVHSGSDGSVLYDLLPSSNDEDRLGTAVARVGDVNLDGIDDFAVGIPWGDGAGSLSGRVAIYSGQDGTRIRTILGTFPAAGLGDALGGNGSDFDGDGIPDVVVGAPTDDQAGPNCGSVSIFSGRTGERIHRVPGWSGGMWFGRRVAGVPDQDGDGLDDFIVGTRDYDGAGSGAGGAWLFSGSDATLLESVLGEYQYHRVGTGVAGLPDLDGDGRGEYAVAASGDLTGPGTGCVTVYRAQCFGVDWYCPGAQNSTGSSAEISFIGSLELAEQTLTLTAWGCPVQEFGFFFYGPLAQDVSVGDGHLCVHQGTIGLFRFVPPVLTDSQGRGSHEVAFDLPPVSGGSGQWQAGDTWYFQFAYRDIGGPGGTGFNFSSAMALSFCP